MTALRWALGLTTVVLGSGYLIVSVVSNGFRRSFGASDNNPLLVILPLVATALLLAGIIFPEQKTLLQIAALAAAGLTGFCLWTLIKESATVMWFALLYLALWFAFYWHVSHQL